MYRSLWPTAILPLMFIKIQSHGDALETSIAVFRILYCDTALTHTSATRAFISVVMMQFYNRYKLQFMWIKITFFR